MRHTPSSRRDVRHMIAKLATILVTILLSAPAQATTKTTPWSADQPEVMQRVAAGEPLVVHTVIALCANDQIDCGEHGLGNPGSLRSNLYWGALYGAKRIFDKKTSGWEAVPQQSKVDGVLARAVYRRFVDGKRWSLPGKRVEQLAILDAVHGLHINSAVAQFYKGATEGSKLVIDDGEKQRDVTVSVTGYAGHNRLMDGFKLPTVEKPEKKRAPTASFVLACLSDRFFSSSLEKAGSTPMVMTRAFMAPEGYAVEATARAFGDNLSPKELRDAVVLAYAKWQGMTYSAASRLFTPG